jgi:hypothetical protein
MSFTAATVAVPSAGGGGGGGAKAPAPSGGKPPSAAEKASAAAAAAAAKRLESFMGTGGSLPDVSTPSARVTQEALLREGFMLHADMDKLHTDLCKAWSGSGGGSGGGGGGGGGKKERVLPLVCPSVEQYGAVVGLQLEEREPVPSAREAAEAAEGEGGGGAGGAPAAPPQRGFLPPQPLRDRNTYLPYRWMFSPLHERSAALRDRLEEMVGALAGATSVPLEAMTIGRICAEAEASRINTASVSLELAGGGGVVKLDLREVPRFAVFPGQIVGVQGASTGADRLAVSDLHTGGAAPYARMPIANARALARVRGKGGPTRVWVAAGPFTDPKDLHFEPLQEFLAEATQAEAGQSPNVLLLQGPFVDAEHPMVRSTEPLALDENNTGMVPSTFKEVWLSGALAWAAGGCSPRCRRAPPPFPRRPRPSCGAKLLLPPSPPPLFFSLTPPLRSPQDHRDLPHAAGCGGHRGGAAALPGRRPRRPRLPAVANGAGLYCGAAARGPGRRRHLSRALHPAPQPRHLCVRGPSVGQQQH